MTQTVRVANGAAVVSADQIHEIVGAWTAEELKELFDTMDRLKEVRQ